MTIQKGITVPRRIGDIANKEMATLKQISEKPPSTLGHRVQQWQLQIQYLQVTVMAAALNSNVCRIH